MLQYGDYNQYTVNPVTQSLINFKVLKEHTLTLALWSYAGFFGVIMCFVLAINSQWFSYDWSVTEMPIRHLVFSLMGAGLMFLLMYPLVIVSAHETRIRVLLTGFIAVIGLAMRLVMFSSEPILEDDYQRYLWDGAVTANGLNPYKYSPADAAKEGALEVFKSLIAESGVVHERINHAELRTIYPPVTQLMFAVAYKISPFSLAAWRFVLLIFDCAALWLLYKLLIHFGRSPLWLVLYWWHPIVIKELFNSAHMEALLTPLLLGALLLAIKKKFYSSSTALMLAAGVKIWPLALFPLVLRPLLKQPGRLALICVYCGLIALIMAIPVLVTTLDADSGFVAYATRWKTNSALFPLLTSIYQWLLGLAPFIKLEANSLVRLTIVIVMLALVCRLSLPALKGDQDLLVKWGLITLAVFLLSPAQFPWYYVWVAPFIVFYPLAGLLVLTITMPLYYIAFHYMVRDMLSFYNEVIVWIIWLPSWALLAIVFLKPSTKLSSYRTTNF